MEPGLAFSARDDDTLTLNLDGWEGPLDLLLNLARAQKVDLREISILALVEQYLAFLEEAKALRLEIAADYLVMAAWLAYLKSCLLLPKDEAADPSPEELALRLQLRLQRLDAMREAGARLMGRDRTTLVGESLWESFPELLGSVFETSYRTAVATGRPLTFEAACPVTARGWFEVRVWPGSDGLAVYVVDVTHRRDAEDAARRATARAALLARVSAELSGQVDTLSALGRLAELVVPVLTDGCIVTLVDREGRARDVGSWHGDPALRGLMKRYAEVRMDTLPGTSPVAAAGGQSSPSPIITVRRPGTLVLAAASSAWQSTIAPRVATRLETAVASRSRVGWAAP